MQLPDYLVKDIDGFVHFSGHRIGLQHLVHYYNEGYSAEMLACEYPNLSLALIHKAIAFYLENQPEVDDYIFWCQKEIEQQRQTATRGPSLAELRQRLASRKQAQGA